MGGQDIFLLVLCLLASSTAETLYKSPGGGTPLINSLQAHYEHVIPVYGNSSVTDCSSQNTDLKEALSEAFKYKSSVQLQLSEGCFIVTSNDLAMFKGWSDFAIVGNGSTIIICSDEVGLTFLSSTGILFRNVSIQGCGRMQNSTSKNFTTNAGHLSFVQFWAGMYFLSCGDIAMDHVNVSSTNGVGMVIYITAMAQIRSIIQHLN